MGADFIITQGSFSYHHYLNFVENCHSNNIKIPIISGIFLPNILSCRKLNGIRYPDKIINEKFNTNEMKTENGFSLIKDIIKNLLQNNIIEGVHIFSLNDLQLCTRILNE